MTRLATFLLTVSFVLAGCSASAQQSSGGSKPVRVKPAQPIGAQLAPAEGEVPASDVEKLRAELASREGASVSDVKVLRTQSVNWPNGALGCPRPGMMYTQAIVPGYLVELELAGKRFAYHASQKGAFKLCESKLHVPVVPESAR